MLVLQHSNNKIINYLGGLQLKKPNRKYRFNKYLLIYKYNDETLLIANLFIGSCISIKTYEYDNLFSNYELDYINYCINNYYIIPEDFDEDLHIKEFRNKLKQTLDITFFDHIYKFSILTTTKCNARCAYCYEKNIKNKKHMSNETAKKVGKYIIDYADLKRDISIEWFGGEPLYNIEPINIISSMLKSSGIKFKSSMATNGYLFNKKLIEKAIYEWNIKDVQITLDGLNDNYNKIKNYIYKNDPNPFKTIIDNIKLLINYHIVVCLRLNFNNDNYKDIKKLVLYLCDEFKEHPNRDALSIYVARLYEYDLSNEYIKELIDHSLELTEIITMKGFNIINSFKGILSSLCVADNSYGIIINPDGYFCNCEHYIDNNFIGHIDNPNKFDFNKKEEWISYQESTELCKDCFFKPECLKLTKCPTNQFKCNEDWKRYFKFNTIYRMITLYHEYIKIDLNNRMNNKSDKINYRESSNCDI